MCVPRPRTTHELAGDRWPPSTNPVSSRAGVQVLVCDVFDHDMITSDDSLGSFVLLPEWYVPELPGVQLPDSPPLGRIGFGFKRADHWWPLHPVGSHKAAGKVQLTVVNKEAEAQQAAASSQVRCARAAEVWLRIAKPCDTTC